ncbi:uncharacterized protein LOC121288724 [Carcharodon carcharias]|uniref:uncharacterized protein LOC121288724 n=1 Tax=Carcharodon carcharias TaxID=13397 RepID=UPI001B7F133E|nr:uncharacterized protein LOC121288724 [Carcharodon carcharias]XP_041063433.1 uncharacterized protein LOC121288724 [Carcharodon carcharias]XP_041063434.1 uncharacterized protein LOC121288724 [Carcharodon carcharias]
MLHYCLTHLAYHFSRQLPKRSRAKFEILMVLLVTIFLCPQIFVLLRPKSSRYCGQPLLINLTSFIIFTFVITGFTVLLTLMDPIPNEVKVAFHVYGVGSFAQGIAMTAFTVAASQCANTTPELYYLSLVLSVLSVLATGFIGFLIPFWLADIFYKGMVLNQRARAGICHKPVASCSYLWHV